MKLLLLVLMMLASACGKATLAPIGTEVSGPFGMATAKNNLYVLNSSFSAEYEQGSILRFAIGTDGSLSKKQALVVPRMGSDMAASPDGNILAVSYSGADYGLRFYDISDPENIKERSISVVPPVGLSMRQLHFFKPEFADAEPGYYLSATINAGTANSRVFVAHISANLGKAKVLLVLPDDLAEGKTVVDMPGYGATAYLNSQNLLLAFPRPGGYSDRVSFLPAPLDELFKVEEADLRRVSVLMVDLPKFLVTKDIKKSSVYVPVAMDKEGNTSKVTDKPSTEFSFINSYEVASAVGSTGCYAGKAAQSLDADSILVATERYNGEFLKFTNWAAQKTSATAKLNSESVAWKDRVVENILNIGFYSRTLGAPGLDGINSNFSEVFTLDTGTQCVPVWTRTEMRRRTVGNEVVRVQANEGRGVSDPLNFGEVEGLKPASQTHAIWGEFIFVASYSFGSVQTLKYHDGKFTEIK